MEEGFYPIFISLFFVFLYLAITGKKKGFRKDSESKHKTLWAFIYAISMMMFVLIGALLLARGLLDGIGIGNPMTR